MRVAWGRRGPLGPGRIGLTLATLAALAILLSLGVWQLQRLAWKQELLAQVAAVRDAPPQPLAQVLARLRAGEDVDLVRVDATCIEQLPDQAAYLYALRDGAPAWRAVSACRLFGAPYEAVLIDRGYVDGANGPAPPPRLILPAPGRVTGVLRKPDAAALTPTTDATPGRLAVFGRDAAGIARLAELTGLGAGTAPHMLLAETETPPPPRVTPSALPAEISNRHLGYAITWFGLAAALAGVYVAVLVRDRRRARTPRFVH